MGIGKTNIYVYKVCIAVVLAGAICFTTNAQDFKRQYRQAKDHFEAARYTEAMDAFKSLTVYDRDNPYPEYASFYYAVSAYRMGFLTVAKDMFLQIRKLYPEWDQLQEVNFWLAKIYFENGDVFQGMYTSQLIQNHTYREDLENLKEMAILNIKDVETLKMLLEDYPTDRTIASNLARALSLLEFPNQEPALLDSIITTFDLPREQYITSATLPVVKKDRYQIALLFPFLANSLEPTPVRKRNQVVLELYEGMKLAADTLQSEGIMIDLLAYDTERSSEQVEKLLKEPELESMDLLVGPIYPEGQTPIQDYSATKKINLVVNPLSNNSDLLLKSPFSFSLQPSHETIGRKSAELVAARTTNKNCIVYYGEAVKDSVMAFNFIQQALALGINVVLAEEVRKETSGRILSQLATATEYDEFKNPTQFKLKRDSIGSIFVASEDPLLFTKVINGVETRGDSVLVVGQENWLEDVTVDLRKFERIKIAFASPNFSERNAQPFQAFRKAYLRKHATLPSENAKIGYEFIMIIGRIMKEYGTYFQSHLLEKGLLPGVLTRGLLLQPSRDNGNVPFTSFRDGELVVIME